MKKKRTERRQKKQYCGEIAMHAWNYTQNSILSRVLLHTYENRNCMWTISWGTMNKDIDFISDGTVGNFCSGF